MREIRLPKPTGEYAVGTFTYTVRDVRKEVMQQGGMRSVAARVYYPVLKESVKDLPEANRSECYVGAERIAGKRFPLILFNHGYNSYREGNSFLCIDLALHGYVVICVNHSHEALCTEFDDGTVLFFDQTLAKRMYEPKLGGLIAMLKLTKEKGSDEELARKFDEAQRKYCRFLMDRLPEWVKDNEAALAYAKKNLSDLIDFEKGVGVSGHSMGGNAAYALCARMWRRSGGCRLKPSPIFLRSMRIMIRVRRRKAWIKYWQDLSSPGPLIISFWSMMRRSV